MKKERSECDPPEELSAQIELDALSTLRMTAKGPAWLVAFLAIVFSATLITSLFVNWLVR